MSSDLSWEHVYESGPWWAVLDAILHLKKTSCWFLYVLWAAPCWHCACPGPPGTPDCPGRDGLDPDPSVGCGSHLCWRRNWMALPPACPSVLWSRHTCTQVYNHVWTHSSKKQKMWIKLVWTVCEKCCGFGMSVRTVCTRCSKTISYPAGGAKFSFTCLSKSAHIIPLLPLPYFKCFITDLDELVVPWTTRISLIFFFVKMCVSD